ncbi:bromodomain-containing protein [Rhizophagus clarus]|uniref:Bromodomain-containing protein n=1 Tax=Rhizophagus clarus TaxID=94130 RepID=A0A8H3L4H2_9GLOM|nr:bromodomain-containing protein [Rhizophagus clarus]
MMLKKKGELKRARDNNDVDTDNSFTTRSQKRQNQILEENKNNVIYNQVVNDAIPVASAYENLVIGEVLNNGINQLKSYINIISKGKPVDYSSPGVFDECIRITKSESNILKGYVILVIDGWFSGSWTRGNFDAHFKSKIISFLILCNKILTLRVLHFVAERLLIDVDFSRWLVLQDQKSFFNNFISSMKRLLMFCYFLFFRDPESYPIFDYGTESPDHWDPEFRTSVDLSHREVSKGLPSN